MTTKLGWIWFSGLLFGTKPNIIFIFADDLGWGDLSGYGSRRVKTPSLDRLAGEGTLFTQFYVAGSVCSPSRSGIMSGQYPARNRVFGHFAATKRNEQRGMPNALNPDLVIILRWPGNIPTGKVNDQSVVGGVDFLPTLAAITGAEVPKGQLLDGEDMSDVWLGLTEIQGLKDPSGFYREKAISENFPCLIA